MHYPGLSARGHYRNRESGPKQDLKIACLPFFMFIKRYRTPADCTIEICLPGSIDQNFVPVSGHRSIPAGLFFYEFGKTLSRVLFPMNDKDAFRRLLQRRQPL